MIYPWTQRQPNFAHDLGPHVQRNRGTLPLRKWQRRPWIGRTVHDAGKRVGRLALSKGKGESEGSHATSYDDPKPLTLILSPSERGEASKARSSSVCISNLFRESYSRLMKSENDRLTFPKIPRASSCALLKPCLRDR